jgi:hypothetical protein
MIICGIEEPLRTDPFCNALDEETGHLINDGVQSEDLNRYGFVSFFESAGENLAAHTALTAFFIRLLEPVIWVNVWRGASPSNPDPRAKQAWGAWAEQTFARRVRDGWEVYREPDFPHAGFAVATKLADPTQVEGFVPSGLNPVESYKVMLLHGEALSPEAFAQPPLRPTIEAWAQYSLCPSQQFLDWALARRSAVVYFKVDVPYDRPGLVFISVDKLPLSDMLASGLVSYILKGTEAESVWKITDRMADAIRKDCSQVSECE